MKDLKIKISIQVCEFTPGEHQAHDSHIAGDNSIRIIEGKLRESLSQTELKEVINREIQFGTAYAQKQISSQIKLPLKMSIRDQTDLHQKSLDNLFPGFRVSLRYDEGNFVIYNIANKEGPYKTTDIVHPKDPWNRVLTTKYEGMFTKLEDGKWTNLYQSHNTYKGVVEYLDPPIDEKILEQYSKDTGLNFSISTDKLMDLPEVYEPEKENCSCCYGCSC